MKKVCFIIICLLASPILHAEWYETQGEAVIINNDKQAAKAQAIENALKKSLLVAGATVSSVRQVVNGLLTQDDINIRASGNVQSLELISESYQDNKVQVTIRADIFANLRQCFSADYKKPVAIIRSHLKQRQHANIGQIFPIDLAFSKKIRNKLLSSSQFTQPNALVNKNTGLNRLVNSYGQTELKTQVMSLAEHLDSQYILYAEVDDLSFGDKRQNTLTFWQDKQVNRHFNFTLFLFNGSNGEKVFEKSYKGSAHWPFDDKMTIDVNSAQFWQSAYGGLIDSLLDKMNTDIDEALMCEPTRASIFAVTGKEVQFNMGSDHGVKIGDEFSLLHVSNVTLDSGKVIKQFQVSPYKIKVSNVTRQTATGYSAKALGNIQRNDIAVRQ